MKDLLYEYMLNHNTFSIPELQMKLSLSYKYIRKYISRLEEDGDIILQPDGLEYSLDLCDFEDYDDDLDYEDQEEQEDQTGLEEDNEDSEIFIERLANKEPKDEKDAMWSDVLTALEKRRKELEKRREELEKRKKQMEDTLMHLEGPPKEYVWVLSHCIKINCVSLISLQAELLLSKKTILQAIDWMRDNHFITKDEDPKICVSKELFLELFIDYRPYVKPDTLLDLNVEENEDSLENILSRAHHIFLNFICKHPTITFAEINEEIEKAKVNLKGGELYESVFKNLKNAFVINDEESFNAYKSKIIKRK